jgi:membrane protease YdiL (CAAX protease family)
VGFGLWLGAGSVLGWAEVEVAASAPEGAVLIGLGAFLLGAILNVWVQETIFVGIVGKNAAEGLASRGLTASRAVLGASAVAVLLFTLLHQPSTPARVANLLIVLGVYALLYAQTGELALPIGVHAGVNYAGGVLVVAPSIAAQRPSLFEVTNSLSGVLGGLNDGAVPHVLIAYVLVLGWLVLRGRELSLRAELTDWTGR